MEKARSIKWGSDFDRLVLAHPLKSSIPILRMSLVHAARR